MIRQARRSGIGAEVADIGEAVTRLLTSDGATGSKVGIGAVLGARAFSVLNHLDTYFQDPLFALMILHGGLTLLDGITGGAIAGLLLVRREGWRAGLLLDTAAPGLAGPALIGPDATVEAVIAIAACAVVGFALPRSRQARPI